MNPKTPNKSLNQGKITATDGANLTHQLKNNAFRRSLQSCRRLFSQLKFRKLLYSICAGFATIAILAIGSIDRPTVIAGKTPPAAIAQTSPTPETPSATETPPSLMICRVNYYLTGLTDFDFVEGSFYADMWLSSNCNNPESPAADGLYFPTAKTYQIPTKDNVKGVGEGSYWLANVRGIFRKDWDLQNFPFDRHTLEIPFEASYPNATLFQYRADKENSAIHDTILLQDGWRIIGYSVDHGVTQYTTNFADPRVEVDKIAQARMIMKIQIQRTSYFSFIKLLGGVYIAFAVCAVCFLLDASNIELYSASLGLMVGALFSVFVNLQVAESTLGTNETLSMIAQIHIITMFYILTAIAMETIFFVGYESQWRINMKRLEHLSEILFVGTYIIINIVAIAIAQKVG